MIYDSSSRGEITSKKSSSFLRGPRVPIILVAFPLWTVNGPYWDAKNALPLIGTF